MIDDFLVYIPKGTKYKEIGFLNFEGSNFIGYQDLNSFEVYFRIEKDFSNFEKINEQIILFPKKENEVECKIKLNGTWENCIWNRELNSIKLA